VYALRGDRMRWHVMRRLLIPFDKTGMCTAPLTRQRLVGILASN